MFSDLLRDAPRRLLDRQAEPLPIGGLVESLLRDGSWIRRTRWGWWAALLPLALAHVFGAAVLGIAAFVRWLAIGAPDLGRAWRSPIVTWGGRLTLLTVTAFSATSAVSDSVAILS